MTRTSSGCSHQPPHLQPVGGSHRPAQRRHAWAIAFLCPSSFSFQVECYILRAKLPYTSANIIPCFRCSGDRRHQSRNPTYVVQNCYKFMLAVENHLIPFPTFGSLRTSISGTPISSAIALVPSPISRR